MNLYLCGQLVYDKEVKNIQRGKTDSSTMVLEKLNSYMPRPPQKKNNNKNWTDLQTMHKNKFKWITTCKN